MIYQTKINVQAFQWTGDNFELIFNEIGKYLNEVEIEEGMILSLRGLYSSKEVQLNSWIVYYPFGYDETIDNIKIISNDDFIKDFNLVDL